VEQLRPLTQFTDRIKMSQDISDAMYDSIQEHAERLGGEELVGLVAEAAFPDEQDNTFPNVAALHLLEERQPGIGFNVIDRAAEISLARVESAARARTRFLSKLSILTMFDGAVSIFNLGGRSS
jgi:hypothetical protein